MLIPHQRSNQHKSNSLNPCHYDGVFRMSSAFTNRITSFQIPTTHQTVDYHEFLSDVKPKALQIIEDSLFQHKALKISFELFGNYYLKTTGEFSIKSFNTKHEIVTVASDLNHLYAAIAEILVTKAQEFNENKSGMLLYIVIICYRILLLYVIIFMLF